jgi:hypothetical protein
MFDRTDIRAAVEAGAISDEGAKRFEAFLKARNDPDRMLDPENLRFLTNFNDVFLTIGIVVLMAGLGFLSAITMIDLMGLPRMNDPETVAEASAFASRIKMVVMIAPLPLLAGAWLLAEYFTGRRRLLLPSMALSFFVVWAASVSAAGLATQFISDSQMVASADGEFNPFQALTGMGYAGFAAATLASAALFWRFRLPFSLFLLAGSIAGLFYTAVVQAAGIPWRNADAGRGGDAGGWGWHAGRGDPVRHEGPDAFDPQFGSMPSGCTWPRRRRSSSVCARWFSGQGLMKPPRRLRP